MPFFAQSFISLLCLVETVRASPHQANIRGILPVSHIPTSFLSSRGDVPPFPAGQLCPTYNTTTFQAASGSVFEVNCGFDYVGGDMHMVYVANLTSCAAACDAANNCVAASLSGFACYLKSKLNPAKRNSGVNAIKVISRNSNTTTVSQSSTVSFENSPPSLGSATTSGQISSASSPTSSSIATSTSIDSSLQARSSTMSRTASAALASSTQIPTSPVCPSDNGTLYLSTNGDTYLVECYMDRYGHDIGSVSIPSLKLADCINACSANPGCVDVSLSGSSCYMKYAAGDLYNLVHQIRGARRVSVGSVSVGSLSTSGNSSASSLTGIQTQTPTCPRSNGTRYLTSNGAVFAIECFIDRYGDDMKMIYVSSFQQCMESCATTPGCLDVSLSGSACYMKKSINPSYNEAYNVLGATLVSSAPIVSSTSASSISGSSITISDSQSSSQSTSSTISPPSASFLSPSSTSSASSSASSPLPTLGVGQSCSSASQCQTGHCILGQCSYQSQDGGPCGSSNDCNSGVCNVFGQCSSGAAGVGCHSDSDCLSGSCTSNQCSPVTTSVASATQSSSTTSSPVPTIATSSMSSSSSPSPTGSPNGADCRLPSDCLSGACLLFQCADKSQIGGFCGIASDCAAGRCNYQQNTCVTGEDGTTCKQNSDCSSYLCNSQGICGAAADGTACIYDTDCKTFCNGNHICGKVQDGSICAQNADCYSGFCNGMKTCGVLNDGAPCSQNTDCISDTCNVASYCGLLTSCFPKCPETAGWSCQTSQTAAPQCVFNCPSKNVDQFGNCRTTDGTYVGLQYAYPSSPWPETGEEIWYAVTCCAPDGSSCYNKFPNFAGGFHGGQDPKQRQPSAIWGACGDSTCDWGSSFNGGGFNWNLNPGFLDRAHSTASSAMGTVQVDNSGTMFLEYPGTTFHCQTADLSILYYDNGNPCIADLECQPSPSGGQVYIEFDYPCYCEVNSQQCPSGTATIQVYYPDNGALLCSDIIGNIGTGSSNTVTSNKCGSQFSINNGDISIEYITFASGNSNIGSTPPTSAQDTGCQGMRYSATYSQS